MKKLLYLALALVLILTLAACGEKILEGELEFTKEDDGKSYCVSGIGYYTDTDIMIPPTHNGLPVTSIGNFAFKDCTGLTSITIPDSVTSIGRNAFYGCKSLTSITFEGTKAQWNAITKGENWDYNTGICKIYCTDGEISK